MLTARVALPTVSFRHDPVLILLVTLLGSNGNRAFTRNQMPLSNETGSCACAHMTLPGSQKYIYNDKHSGNSYTMLFPDFVALQWCS